MSALSLPAAEPKRTPSVRFNTPLVSIREDAASENRSQASSLKSDLGISEVTARILIARGVSDPEVAKGFLSPSLKDHLPNPSEMKNLTEAANLILDSIENKETITVYSDFDVDGLTSSAQLVLFLDAIGALVSSYVPNRFVEGYGVSTEGISALAARGTQLLITVDCGISSIHEIALARRKGMKSVILDHHIPGPELPQADVIVDPAQDGCAFADHKLAAAGVVWMLLVLLRTEGRKRASFEQVEFPDPKDFLDLAAIGTICDMVPLSGLNRLIAHRGVEALRQARRVGIEALKDVAKVRDNPRFGSGHISFNIGPRINAAGRLDDANQVVTLLTTKSSKKAKTIAQRMNRLNDQRRLVENQVRESCIAKLKRQGDPSERSALTVYGEQYHLGVIGIAAQRLVEEFYRPAAVMGPGQVKQGEKVTDVIKGSVRGIRGFHVAEALESLSEILLTHGGHAQAGGFSLLPKHLDDFHAGFLKVAEEKLGAEELQREVNADVRITLSEVDYELATELQFLAPFGIGNPSPLLVSEGVRVDSVSAIKGAHLRVRLADSVCSRNAVAWNMQGHPLLRKDEVVNVAYQVELNTYQGVSSVQLSLKEVWT